MLDAALDCFWGRGYEATSIRVLVEAMGISGPSLYNAFGDKRELYVEALEHYCRTRTHPMLERFERSHPGIGAVAAFFAEIIERSVADRERRGCFLVNAALDVAPHDRAMARLVAAHLDAIRGFLKRALAAGLDAGEVSLATGADGAADNLVAVLLGVRVLARTRPEQELLQRTVATALIGCGIPHAHLGIFGTASSTASGTGGRRRH